MTNQPVVENPSATRIEDGEQQPVKRTCAKCSAEFIAVPIFFGGREIAQKTVCDPCIEVDRLAIERRDAIQKQHVARLEGDDRESAIRDLIQKAGANAWEHGHASFDNFDASDSPKALTAARDFAAAIKNAQKYLPIRGLYLWGETGPGKTHLSVAVIRWLIENGYPPQQIVFDQAASLIARIQDTYGRTGERTMDVLDKRTDAGLWICDDLGTERSSDDVARHLTVIFSERAMRPTLVTSNYSLDWLQKNRPELKRVLSRFGPSYFRTVEVKGRDRRFD